MIFKNLFSRKKRGAGKSRNEEYSTTAEFVEHNIDNVKKLLSSVGYNDLLKRLEDMAAMTHCHVVALCQKLPGQNKYMVVDSSERTMCPRGTVFSWMHTQPMASADAESIISTLPFNVIGGTGFISVPVKNERNMLVGILLGISTDRLTDIDGKVRLMHILAPLMEAEVRCVKLRQDVRQCEQRIASLNQSIEVISTDLRRERELTAESQQLKSIFLTNLSHEIRTPMNVIIGFADLLDKTEDEAERAKFIDIVRQSGYQLLNVIDNLVEISKLQSNYMLKPACPVQLNEMLTKIKMKYQEILRKEGKDVEIETVFSLKAPNDTIWNSDEIITKVLSQILDNSCRFTTSGKITISYVVNHKEAAFCVTDTGPGFKPGSEKVVFDMFGDVLMDDVGKGKGIGLAVAAKYLSLCGGKIWVDTAYRNGACVNFTIPTDKL